MLEAVPFQNTDNVIDSVKPTGLIQKILEIGTTGEDEDIVLDFFSGTGTTAQAIFQQNAKDKGRRRFIVVQMPCPLDTPEKKLKTIADVTKQRIRSASKKLSDATKGELSFDEGPPQDLGTSIFKLVPSSFKPWPGVNAAKPEEYARTMELFADPLVDGWKPESVIYEVALREGFSLTARLEKLSGTKSGTVWRVTDADKGQSFRICLDDELKPATVRALALAKDDLFICRDVALDDKLAANLALQCRLKTI